MAEKRRRTAEGQAAAEESETWLASLDRVEQIQEELEVVNDEVASRVLQLEREANTQRSPLYEQRRASIAGVPGFWPGALMGHPLLAEYVTDRDEEVFEHGSTVKLPSWPGPELALSSAPAPPRGGCARRRWAARHSQHEAGPLGAQQPAHWAPSHCLGCSGKPSP